MNATDILKLPLDRPDLLFQRKDVEGQYRKLAAQLHPDRGGDAAAFAHMAALRQVADEMNTTGHWPGVFEFESEHSGIRTFSYKSKHTAEHGSMYVGQGRVIFEVNSEYADLAKHGVQLIKSMRFQDAGLKKEGARYLPSEVHFGETLDDGRFVYSIAKEPEQLCLADILTHFGGKLEPRVVAWIVSSLCNINCVLRYGVGLAHGDVSPTNYFVNVADHSGVLLGGWLFAQRVGAPLLALPARSAALVPLPAHGKPLASTALTGALVRATGRELLGSIHGSKLLMDPNVPPAVLNWLRSAATEYPAEDYRNWQAALHTAYGKRTFHKTALTAKDLYP